MIVANFGLISLEFAVGAPVFAQATWSDLTQPLGGIGSSGEFSNLSRRNTIPENLAVAKITIGFGVFLIALGLAGYCATNMVSWTALIPAFVGLPLAILGALATKEQLRKHAMHAAVMVGLLGFLGAAYSFSKPLRVLISGQELERPIAALMQGIMTLTCAIFVGLCVKSFIDARRARAQKTE
jgi:sulfite exporter TauE/SafE